MSSLRPGVSIIVPVHNGARTLPDTLRAIACLDWPGDGEVIIVDDHSSDRERVEVPTQLNRKPVTVLTADRHGAANALNTGLRAAQYAWLAQLDQDVLPARDWLQQLWASVQTRPDVAAAQGTFRADARDGVLGHLAALDLQMRYQDKGASPPDHVCTGNTLYRTEVLRSVGGFDAQLGYGYDNDMSYRLGHAGWQLLRVDGAVATHRWPATLRDYLRQQFGQGYGRLDLIRKYPRRWRGDCVSGWRMIAHAGLMTVVSAMSFVALVACIAGVESKPLHAMIGVCLGTLVAERLITGMVASGHLGEPSALWWTVLHVLRDVAWAVAVWLWLLRRITGHAALPQHSMRVRTACK
jgi:cellulose synthase/poly-beta-1,6-N-acetylglucosamine synthase-like glycosyltransferase